MERQERKDGVDGGTTTHTHVHMCMCNAIKICSYKKTPSQRPCVHGLSRVFSARQVVAARNGKTAAETECRGEDDSFSSQKKGNSYTVTKYSIRTIIDG